MNELAAIIRHEIQAAGILSCARFMELALYHPQFGYYERNGAQVGGGGDYYTSVSVGSLFGELLSFHFAEWLAALPMGPYQLVEAGAHNGCLAADILEFLQVHRPAVFERLEYWLIEPSPLRQLRQRATLAKFASSVRWFPSLQTLPVAGVRGVIFCNELLDSMPVHRLGWDAKSQAWFEWGVTVEQCRFVWARMTTHETNHRQDGLLATWPILPPELLSFIPDGFTIEICQAAENWWHQAGTALRGGWLLTLDYGLTAEEFFVPQRAHGTLRAYCRHRPNDDVLADVGEQDLTAHVNFTALQQAGESVGLKTEGLLSQAKFLTSVAERTWQADSAFVQWTSTRRRQFQTLVHQEHLGRAFRVLVQRRCGATLGVPP